ncbi:MAG: aminoacyl-tRNA hydrolase [Eggerthellaceae bacterium]|nr:aminoacyl-tRNA hydrolase [Eggerthellaceae bacterium]MBR3257995.1 aminoacyl-tRNA hydrolase [Eggerthellaceae bacterium]
MGESTAATWVIAGLGNPGAEYAHTRHNAGFDCLDLIAEDVRVRYWKAKDGAVYGEGTWHDVPVVLVKPQQFMNLSGGPVKAVMARYKVKPDHLIVIHDEMDFEPGRVKVKFGGGLAGHNGLKSINEKLGTPEWFRVRIGIGKAPGRMEGADYVLSVPKGEAKEAHESGIDAARGATLCLVDNGLEKTQQRYN